MPAKSGATRDGGTPAAMGTLGNPPRIVGLEPAEVTRLLGEPTFVRRDAPAEIWQYRGKLCVLDLFLYEEGDSHRVVYVEARTETAEPVPVETCIGGLLAAPPRTS